MAKVNKQVVEHIANLSNLNLTEEEFEKFTPQIANIVDFVSELSEVDTNNTLPTVVPAGLNNILREDEVDATRQLSVDEALSGTEETYNDMIKVPAILKK